MAMALASCSAIVLVFADFDESITLTPSEEDGEEGPLGASNMAGIPIRAAPRATVPAARDGCDEIKQSIDSYNALVEGEHE